MSAYDEILGAMPTDDIARQVGASPDEVRQAAAAVLPALLGGMGANAQDPRGAQSLLQALGQHDPGLLDGGADLGAIDQQDGERIAAHVFGAEQDAVAERLGASPLSGSGVGSSLVKKLIPILAPMVLSWLAKRVLGGAGGAAGRGPAGPVPGGSASLPGSGSSSGGPGSLDAMLRDVLGSATGGAASGGSARPAPTSGGVDAGSIIGDLLGGILGGGRR